ncbi:hypothetical protein PRIPAC_83932 [Pristionchus pacificus]|uniref:Uncharacterized protein n=1 Tax=Pristionchus pacificus TaxID=54126 RepID=A0A454XMK4_PRIPA|nr:hypothetical protein PRIPAC_83932 [Pristionchus pacificus]|eukprot:PDM67207.1 hypothetical protein PRIPAC_48624 [Pristionchus pacificus]
MTHVKKEKKGERSGCFRAFRTTIRSILSRRSSKPSPTFHVSMSASVFATPTAAAAAAPLSFPAAAAAAAAEPVYDRISLCSVESDLDQEPIPAYIRNICARLHQQPAMPVGVAAPSQLLQLQQHSSRRLRTSPDVPEDPQPTGAESAFWTGITIDKSHEETAPVPGAPVETRLTIKDQSANRSHFPVALEIIANGAEVTLTFKRGSISGQTTHRPVILTADLDDYDTIDIEWNRECAYDLMELSEDVRVKCKFAGDRHFITLSNAEIYA